MAAPRRRRKTEDVLPAGLRRRMEGVRRPLLRIHKALLDYERVAYEKVRGRIGSSGEFLQLVIHDAWFAWLRPLSELIVRIDELLESEDAGVVGDGEAAMAQVKEMLRADEGGGEFQRHYYRALQDAPQVVGAHADWKKAEG
jgi:hypothetical protein